MSEPTSGIMATINTSIGIVVAQIAGQLVSLSFMAPMSPRKKLTTLVVGVVSAHYGTRAMLFFFPQYAVIEEVIGFFCGLMGMAVIKAVLDAIPIAAKHLAENFSWKK